MEKDDLIMAKKSTSTPKASTKPAASAVARSQQVAKASASTRLAKPNPKY